KSSRTGKGGAAENRSASCKVRPRSCCTWGKANCWKDIGTPARPPGYTVALRFLALGHDEPDRMVLSFLRVETLGAYGGRCCPADFREHGEAHFQFVALQGVDGGQGRGGLLFEV